jgi:hypothetical protein
MIMLIVMQKFFKTDLCHTNPRRHTFKTLKNYHTLAILNQNVSLQMNLTKVKTLTIMMLIVASIMAQDDEIIFHISKPKTPSIYPDTFKYLEYGRSYLFVIRGVEPSEIDSIRTSSGNLFHHDSIIRISLPVKYSTSNQDYAPLTFSVFFKPDAHVDSMMIERRYPLRAPLRPRPITERDRLFGGLSIITIKGQIFPPLKKVHIIGATHYLTRSKLGKISDVTWFKPYMGKDTPLSAIDSVHARVLIDHNYHRYSMKGSELTAEVKAIISKAKPDDDIWINLYYKDPATQDEKKKSIFFRVSALPRRDS